MHNFTLDPFPFFRNVLPADGRFRELRDERHVGSVLASHNRKREWIEGSEHLQGWININILFLVGFLQLFPLP